MVVAINVLLTRAIKYEIFKSWHSSLALSRYFSTRLEKLVENVKGGFSGGTWGGG